MTRPPISLRVSFLALAWPTQLALVIAALLLAACPVLWIVGVVA